MSGCWPDAESRVEYDDGPGYPTGEMSVGEADDGYRGLNPGNRPNGGKITWLSLLISQDIILMKELDLPQNQGFSSYVVILIFSVQTFSSDWNTWQAFPFTGLLSRILDFIWYHFLITQDW